MSGWEVVRMAAPDVWVTKYDGSDLVRAENIAAVGRDYNGNITVRLSGGEGSAVTLVAPGPRGGPFTPRDFHRQLLQMVAELSDTAEAILVRPVCEDASTWKWVTEPL
jgi:hypothetical protein